MVAVLVGQTFGQFAGTLRLFQGDAGFVAGDGQLVGTGVGLESCLTGGVTSFGFLGNGCGEFLDGSLKFSDGLLVVGHVATSGFDGVLQLDDGSFQQFLVALKVALRLAFRVDGGLESSELFLVILASSLQLFVLLGGLLIGSALQGGMFQLKFQELRLLLGKCAFGLFQSCGQLLVLGSEFALEFLNFDAALATTGQLLGDGFVFSGECTGVFLRCIQSFFEFSGGSTGLDNLSGGVAGVLFGDLNGCFEFFRLSDPFLDGGFNLLLFLLRGGGTGLDLLQFHGEVFHFFVESVLHLLRGGSLGFTCGQSLFQFLDTGSEFGFDAFQFLDAGTVFDAEATFAGSSIGGGFGEFGLEGSFGGTFLFDGFSQGFVVGDGGLQFQVQVVFRLRFGFSFGLRFLEGCIQSFLSFTGGGQFGFGLFQSFCVGCGISSGLGSLGLGFDESSFGFLEFSFEFVDGVVEGSGVA